MCIENEDIFCVVEQDRTRRIDDLMQEMKSLQGLVEKQNQAFPQHQEQIKQLKDKVINITKTKCFQNNFLFYIWRVFLAIFLKLKYHFFKVLESNISYRPLTFVFKEI